MTTSRGLGLFVVFALVSGCAGVSPARVASVSTDSARSGHGASGGWSNARGSDSAAAERESDFAERDFGSSARGERGIPTPQPARDPSFAASSMAPVPQPPLPEPRHGGNGGGTGARGY